MRGPGPATNDMTDLIVPAALRYWILFLLVFTLLGYSVGFSILFGALGGFVGGMISAWWQVRGGEPMPLDPDVAASKKLGTPSLASIKFPRWKSRTDRRHLRRRQKRR